MLRFTAYWLTIVCLCALSACGSSSSTLPAASGPITLQNDSLMVSFEADPEFGVRLSGLAIRGKDALRFENDPIGPDADARLWEARLTDLEGRQQTLHPGDAQSFESTRAEGPLGEPAWRFTWRSVRREGSDSLDVTVLAWIDSQEPLCRFSAIVDRTEGSSATASLDELDLPIVTIRPPGRLRAGETLVEAQMRTRLLLPSLLVDERDPSPNLPLYFWLHPIGGGAARDVSLQHPGPRQLLQFAALSDLDPQSPSFRHLVYFGTEDATGHLKRFRHRALITDGEEPRYQWRATYVPPFANRRTGEFDQYGNTFETPYPAVVGALESPTDATWYEAASIYRRFVERSGMAGMKLEDNPRFGESIGASLYSIMVQSQPTLEPPEIYDEFVDRAFTLRRALETEALGEPATFMQWQNYFDQASPVGNPGCPLSDVVDHGVLEAIARAKQLGIRVAPYLRPSELSRCTCWYQELDPAAEAFDRDGDPLPPPSNEEDCPDGTAALDYGHPDAVRFFAGRLARTLVRQFGFSGLYIDVLSGMGSRLTYDPPGLPRAHLPHGGDYFQRGKVASIEALRAMLRLECDGDPHTFLIGEATEEYLAGTFDAMGWGPGWLPGHLNRAERALLEAIEQSEGIDLPELSDVSVHGTDWSPPLWNVVYHEWSPAQAPGMPWTTVGLANGEYYPATYETPDGPRDFKGLSQEQWVDLLCFVPAQLSIVGSKPSVLVEDVAFQSPMIELDENGRLVVDPTRDPGAYGLEILAFVQKLQESLHRPFAGRFLLYGRSLRPLPEVLPADTAINPTFACRQTWDGHANVTYPFQERPIPSQPPEKKTIGAAPYPVSRVLHSVWRSPEGQLGLVLINWSRQEASWSGRFRPEWYGLSADEAFHIEEVSLEGDTVDLGEHLGERLLIAGGTSDGSVIDLGEMPPHTVRVFVISKAQR
ncbi:MAG: hypothetical protein RL885_25280 [Planctomycetota bacterium]